MQNLQFDEEGSIDPSLLVDCPGCSKCAPHGGYILKISAGRPTKSHEQVFLLTKSARYFYDQEAVREACQSGASDVRKMVEGLPRIGGKHKDLVDPLSKASSATNIGQRRSVGDPSGRNARSVWTIATEPYSEAHFAVFPSELARRCIRAGTSEKGCCPACGAPWARVVERSGLPVSDRANGTVYTGAAYAHPQSAPRGPKSNFGEVVTLTTGWRPTCTCDAGEPVPATVLDPFGGAGTTALAAEQLGRDAILIDLNPEYAAMARKRIDGYRARRMIGAAPSRAPALPGQMEIEL